MEDEDYLFGDEDDDLVEYYPVGDAEDEDEDNDSDDDELGSSSSDVDADDVDSSAYHGKMTSKEIWLSSAYDDIVKAGQKEKENAVEVAALTVILANPRHTSVATAQHIVQDLLNKQGHNRIVNSVYTPDTPLIGEDVDEDLLRDGDGGFNRKFTDEARDQIAEFVNYLSTRDLSKDSVISRRRKQRQLPAFIIFLFSSGMYDLLLNCPTMPEEYAKQIDMALKKITERKYDIVEELAKRYEEAGRPKVAERVRKLQLAWFAKEPAEIRSSGIYSDLDITYEDVAIYREFRSKFTNVSRTITQDVISDLIDVVIDKEAGIFEKLKDKTRADAIADVKQEYKRWAKEKKATAESETIASKIIYKEVDSLTD